MTASTMRSLSYSKWFCFKTPKRSFSGIFTEPTSESSSPPSILISVDFPVLGAIRAGQAVALSRVELERHILRNVEF